MDKISHARLDLFYIYVLQVALSDPFLHPDRGDQDWSPSHAAASARGAAAEPTPTSMDCYKVKKKKKVMVSDSPYCPVFNMVIS